MKKCVGRCPHMEPPVQTSAIKVLLIFFGGPRMTSFKKKIKIVKIGVEDLRFIYRYY